MSQINTNAILDASGGTTATVNGFTPTVSNMAGRNRIINGDMRIDQRNAGAAVTPTTSSTYTVDRWCSILNVASKFSVQRSSVAPEGFTNSTVITSLSSYSAASGDYFGFSHRFEGFNTADFGWGLASAKTVTLSFWVRSSLTGTFGGSFRNGNSNRSYVFTFPVNSANTWEYKTITISGDTSGTWNTANTQSIDLTFDLGSGANFSGASGAWSGSNLLTATGATSVVGTSGATFYITGVQLEEGRVATPFCPAGGGSYGAELALCQRYYQRSVYPVGVARSYGGVGWAYGQALNGNWIGGYVGFQTSMRTDPTVRNSGIGGTLGTVSRASNSANVTASVSISSEGVFSEFTSAAWTPNEGVMFNWDASAEL